MAESLSGQAAGGLKAAQAGRPLTFHDPRTFVPHAYAEHTADLGEVAMNYAVTGSPSKPPLLLIPELMKEAGVAVEYASLPDAAHAMHNIDPERFAKVVAEWAKKLPA